MFKTFTFHKSRNNETITIDESIEKQSSKIINLVGYVILLLALFDIMATLIPPKFFDPNWELATIGKIVETVWAPLLGLILIFYRRQQESIKYRELKVLSLFSLLSLILGIIYLLTVPLLISDTFRIARSNLATVNIQVEAQRTQIEQIKQQLDNANELQLNTFLSQYQKQAPQLKGSSTQELKANFLSKIDREQAIKTSQIEKNLTAQQRSLSKLAIKWILGALISGVSFICIWQETKWSRAIIAYKQQNQKTLTLSK
jgi:uncharacterized membrane protein